MLRVVEHVVGRALFDDDAGAGIHHDAVGDLGDDAEIVGDERTAAFAALLQVADQFQDLRLGGDVEPGWSARRPIRVFGSSANAIAIMARWRWPPDSSCG